MTSEIRANTLKNRVGLGTVSYTNTGIVVSGIVTANSFSGPYNGTDIVGTGITLTSTDTGSSAGPELKLFRNSASPADADYLGQIKFAGESDTSVERNYAKITGKILDASNGTEDGILEFAHIKAGSQTITGRWRSDSLQLLNGTNLSVAGNTTLTGDLDVDGHTNLDNVNIAGVTTSTGNIYADNYFGNGGLTLNNNGNPSINLTSTSTTGSSRINFGDPDSTSVGKIYYVHNGDYMQFSTAYNERLRINSSGNARLGGTSDTTDQGYRFTLQGSANATYLQFFDNGTGTTHGSDGSFVGLINQDFYVWNREAKAVVIGSSNNERLRIDSSGRIGIGCIPTTQFNHNLIQIGNQATLGANGALSSTGQTFLTHNLYYDPSGTYQVFNTSNANEGGIIQIREAYFAFSNSAATTGTPTVIERFRIGSVGQIGIAGANYGTSGQVLTSQGSGSAVTWSTISGTTINNNADNRVITGSGTANTLEGESTMTYTSSLLKLATASSTSTDAELLHLVGGGTANRGLKIGTGRATGANQNHAAAIYDAINSESSGYGSQHRFKIAGTDCFTIGYNGDFGFVGINDTVPYPDSIGGSTVNTCLELGSPSGTDTASVIKFNGRDGNSNLNKCQIQWSGAHNRFDITVNGNQALQIQPNKDVEVTDGDLVIGTSGHGISFSATGNAGNNASMSNELLDDYEEGSWTPFFYAWIGGGVPATHDTQIGRYTKVGNLVHITYDLKGDRGSMNHNYITVGGLPFTYASSNRGWAAIPWTEYVGSENSTSATRGHGLQFGGGATAHAWLTGYTSTSSYLPVYLSTSYMSNGNHTRLRGSATYFTNQ